MDWIVELLTNPYVVAAMSSWLLAQIIKII